MNKLESAIDFILNQDFNAKIEKELLFEDAIHQNELPIKRVTFSIDGEYFCGLNYLVKQDRLFSGGFITKDNAESIERTRIVKEYLSKNGG